MEQEPEQPALAAELEAMFEEDQAVFGIPPGTAEEKAAVSLRQCTRLRAIIAHHGWPGIRLVGARAAKTAWLVVQHADVDPALQHEALGLMRQAWARHDVDGRDLALLEDRVRTNAGQLQPYGSQFHHPQGWPAPRPMEDPEHVDDRRAAMGMEPLADYVRRARDFHREMNPRGDPPPEDGWPGGR